MINAPIKQRDHNRSKGQEKLFSVDHRLGRQMHDAIIQATKIQYRQHQMVESYRICPSMIGKKPADTHTQRDAYIYISWLHVWSRYDHVCMSFIFKIQKSPFHPRSHSIVFATESQDKTKMGWNRNVPTILDVTFQANTLTPTCKDISQYPTVCPCPARFDGYAMFDGTRDHGTTTMWIDLWKHWKTTSISWMAGGTIWETQCKSSG